MSKNPILIPQPFANNGSKNSIQNTRQQGQDPEDATWSDGFPNVTMQPIESGGLPPKGMDFNGILHALSASIVHQQKGGFFYYDTNYAKNIGGYHAGAILIADDNSKLFISTIDNNTNNPNQNINGWVILAGAGVNADTATKLQTSRKIGGIDFDGTNDIHLPISGRYIPTEKYEAGDLVKVDGEWYECYHPDGCKGKDPRDPVNRPVGWQNTDQSQPYYWLKIGRWLSFPETGSPIYLPSTILREGLIKYRNDGNLHKDKFWRLAELYPNLISNNFINIADLRGEFLRGLDDGRGIDNNRTINSWQKQQIIEHLHNLEGWTGGAGSLIDKNTHFLHELGGVAITQGDGGIAYTHKVGKQIPENCRMIGTQGVFDKTITGIENRPRNVAMIIATRI